jgi:uroporphyrinogen decarboxylase
VIQLRQQFGHRLCLVGNLDVTLLERNNRQEIRDSLLRKLNAAKGGGFIPQSDHSVPSNVSGETFDYVVELVRSYGRYPLQLGEHDIPELR